MYKIMTVDADIWRGWTTLETIRHIPVDAWAQYSEVLAHHPIATKAATSATVYAIGDVIAQGTEGSSVAELDRVRTLRSLLAGLIGHGPLSHYWYLFCDNLFENVLHWSSTEWWSFFPKIVLDQTTWGPVWNSTYILLIGLMRFDSFDIMWRDIRRSTVPLLLTGLKLWPLAHCITYGLIPIENRLLWVDTVEIAWVTILATAAASAHSGNSKPDDESHDPNR